MESDRKSLRGVIVGLGTIASGHLAGYNKLSHLANIHAIVDISAARRAHASRFYPSMDVAADLAEVLTDNSYDFVDVCSPPDSHYAHARTALLSGCHVLCEKPLTENANEFTDLKSVALSKERILYPIHNYKFAPAIVLIQDQIQSGNIGDPIIASFRMLRSRHSLGVREWQPNWRRIRQISGGGVLRDLGPHMIYLCISFLGRLPAKVSCVTASIQTDQLFDTEDTAFLRLDFSNSITATIDLSWSSELMLTQFSLGGNRGSVTVLDEIAILGSGSRTKTRRISSEFNDPAHSAWFPTVLLDFLDVVDRPYLQTALLGEAAATICILQTAYESASQGSTSKVISYPNWLSDFGDE